MATNPTIDDTSDADVFYCARHPQVETVLRCNRCDTPICPRCLVQTPVGAKCPTCAKVSRLPTVDISLMNLSWAFGAATVSGTVVGAAWGYLMASAGILGFFLIFIAIGMGWAVSESISLATNRKRSVVLGYLAIYAMVLAFFVHNIVGWNALFVRGDIWSILAAGAGAYWAYQALKP